MSNYEQAKGTAYSYQGTGLPTEGQLAIAQLQATLAVADEMRKANLIAMFGTTFPEGMWSEGKWNRLGEELNELTGVDNE